MPTKAPKRASVPPSDDGADPQRPAAAPTSARPRAPAPEAAGPRRLHEPVWLVRIVLVLFLVGFAAFLAREVAAFVASLS